ncbi:unnamed protein product [Gordionus sp. m RMFG-2023]
MDLDWVLAYTSTLLPPMQLIQPNARHGLKCNLSQGRHLRHKAINKIIHNAFNKAKIPNILEPTNLSFQDGLRPDGLTCTPWSNGNLIWDAICVSSFPSSTNSNRLRGK